MFSDLRLFQQGEKYLVKLLKEYWINNKNLDRAEQHLWIYTITSLMNEGEASGLR
jgi:hypothetical protein